MRVTPVGARLLQRKQAAQLQELPAACRRGTGPGHRRVVGSSFSTLYRAKFPKEESRRETFNPYIMLRIQRDYNTPFCLVVLKSLLF